MIGLTAAAAGVKELDYDRLVLATGSRPKKPPIPGLDLPGVHPTANLHQAERIKEAVASFKQEVKDGTYPDAEHSFPMQLDAESLLAEEE